MKVKTVIVLDKDNKQKPLLKYVCERKIKDIESYRETIKLVYRHIYKKNVTVYFYTSEKV